MTIRAYSSPEAFKQAIEQRLRASAKTGAEFARKRQLLVFDRFLARVVAVLGDAARDSARSGVASSSMRASGPWTALTSA